MHASPTPAISPERPTADAALEKSSSLPQHAASATERVADIDTEPTQPTENPANDSAEDVPAKIKYSSVTEFDTAFAAELCKVHANAVGFMHGNDKCRAKTHHNLVSDLFGMRECGWGIVDLRVNLALHAVMPRKMASARPEMCNVDADVYYRYLKVRQAVSILGKQGGHDPQRDVGTEGMK
jgi:hypothetical protein